MHTTDTDASLRAELEEVDKALVKPMELLSITVLGAATALMLLQLFLDAPTQAVFVPLLAFGLGASVAGRTCGRRAKGLLLARHGYRCGNCGKTPDPVSAASGFPLSYCPHCQRKR